MTNKIKLLQITTAIYYREKERPSSGTKLMDYKTTVHDAIPNTTAQYVQHILTKIEDGFPSGCSFTHDIKI